MKFFTIITILMGLIIFDAKAQPGSYSKNPSQMSKQEFLTLTSESDSLSAVVNMFFRKRITTTSAGFVVAGSATFIGMAYALANATQQILPAMFGMPVEDTNDPGGTIALVGITAGAVIFTIGRANYSKNNLYELITDYQETNTIPYQYARKLIRKDFAYKSRNPILDNKEY
jgi:hypothetical protein